MTAEPAGDPVCDVRRGRGPLLVSIPHDGRRVPPDIAARMSDAGRALPDTDWHVARLYAFAVDLGATVVAARYSRYVVDLNRPPDDTALYAGKLATGLCPTRTFDGEAIYADGGDVGADERRRRVERYWRPYHECLDRELGRIRERFGYALLWDAHSIASRVPALFDGTLPVLNLGTFGGSSAAPDIEEAVWAVAELAPFSSVRNGRFVGGYITRSRGDPGSNVHAMQLEIAQRSYMDEKTLRYDVSRAGVLAESLRDMLRAFIESAHARHARAGES